MGVNYTVIPVTDEPELTNHFTFCCMQSPEDEAIEQSEGPLADAIRARQIPQWLKAHGINYEALPHTGRNPSLNETVAALSQTDYVTAKHSKGWDSILLTNDFTDQKSLLQFLNYSGNPDQPHYVYFEKGASLTVLHAAIYMAKVCGPLIVIPDCNDIPVLVQGDDDELELAEAWPDL